MNSTCLAEKLYLSTIDDAAAALARKYQLGLELADFCYAPCMEDASALARADERREGVERLWLHAPFAELCPCAVDPLVREIAARRYRQTISLARSLGIVRIVVHGGFLPHVYAPQWYVEQSVLFWRDFLQSAPQDLTIALENVMEPSPELLVRIVQEVGDPRLGLCLDVGHANTCVSETPPLAWIDAMQPYLRHVHLHNNAGGEDLHDPLGQGSIPMRRVLDAVLTRCPDATLTLENLNCAASLDWLRAQGYWEEPA